MPRAVAAHSNTGRHTESYLCGRMVWLREMNKSGGLSDQNVTDEGWHATKCTINVWTNLNAWKFLELQASVSAYHPPTFKHTGTHIHTHTHVSTHSYAVWSWAHCSCSWLNVTFLCCCGATSSCNEQHGRLGSSDYPPTGHDRVCGPQSWARCPQTGHFCFFLVM